MTAGLSSHGLGKRKGVAVRHKALHVCCNEVRCAEQRRPELTSTVDIFVVSRLLDLKLTMGIGK